MPKPRCHVLLADSAQRVEESKRGLPERLLKRRTNLEDNSTVLGEDSGMCGTVSKDTLIQLAQSSLPIEERRSDGCQDTSRKEAGKRMTG